MNDYAFSNALIVIGISLFWGIGWWFDKIQTTISVKGTVHSPKWVAAVVNPIFPNLPGWQKSPGKTWRWLTIILYALTIGVYSIAEVRISVLLGLFDIGISLMTFFACIHFAERIK